MQNPVTGSGGMLTGVVDEAGPASPLGLAAGDRIATLVSLSLTPLAVTDGLARWDGQSEQVPCAGHAILFGRSIAAVLPADLPVPPSPSRSWTCAARLPSPSGWCAPRCPGAGLRWRGGAGRCWAPDSAAVAEAARGSPPGPAERPVVAILGAGGKSGSLSAAAARRAGAGTIIGVVPGRGRGRRGAPGRPRRRGGDRGRPGPGGPGGRRPVGRRPGRP